MVVRKKLRLLNVQILDLMVLNRLVYDLLNIMYTYTVHKVLWTSEQLLHVNIRPVCYSDHSLILFCLSTISHFGTKKQTKKKSRRKKKVVWLKIEEKRKKIIIKYRTAVTTGRPTSGSFHLSCFARQPIPRITQNSSQPTKVCETVTFVEFFSLSNLLWPFFDLLTFYNIIMVQWKSLPTLPV